MDQPCAQLFLSTFKNSIVSQKPTRDEVLRKLSLNFWQDLTGHLDGYFSFADKQLITVKAAKLLAEKIQDRGMTPSIDEFLLDQVWREVMLDFNQNSHWGFHRARQKPKGPENKVAKELLPYLWVFIQTGIIMKLVVFYFGLNSADDSDSFFSIGLAFALAFSFFSLVFFAWRQHKKHRE